MDHHKINLSSFAFFDNMLVPEVSAIYAGDLDTLLKDCTAEEIESIMTMLRQMKAALIKARPTEN